jgi:hypothetical protein
MIPFLEARFDGSRSSCSVFWIYPRSLVDRGLSIILQSRKERTSKMLQLDVGYAINTPDWKAIEDVLDRESIRSVIEFGAGVSTKLFFERGVDLVSFETRMQWIETVSKECPGVICVHWNNADFPTRFLKRRFDLAFVDGQDPRDSQAIVSRLVSNRIIFHDGYHAGPWKIAKFIEDQDMLDDWVEQPIGGTCRYFVNKDLGERR